ncbi:hypothetical protein ACS0TY_031916 [Phlomoides rotata]
MATSMISSDDYVSASPERKRKKSEVEFSKDEEALTIRMFNLVGERWSLIAGRIPGRSAEEIKNYWMTQHSTTELRK